MRSTGTRRVFSEVQAGGRGIEKGSRERAMRRAEGWAAIMAERSERPMPDDVPVTIILLEDTFGIGGVEFT